MSERPRILVIGATGVIGSRIKRLAEKLIPEAQIIGACRNPPAGEKHWQALDLKDIENLPAALTGASVMIHAAGPFDHAPEPLIAAAAKAGCDYVDIADDLDFIGRARRALDSEGTIRGVTGASTTPALVEVLAAKWQDVAAINAIDVFLSMGTRNPVSPALVYSLLRPLGRPIAGGERCLRRLERRELAGGLRRLAAPYPSTFDSAGLAIGDRHLPARFFIAFDRRIAMLGLFALSYVTPLLSDGALRFLARMAAPCAGIFGLFGRRLGALLITATDERGRPIESVEVRAATEGLDVTALPAVWAAHRLLQRSKEVQCGALDLQALVTPEEATVWLTAEGKEVTWIHRPALQH